MTRGELLFVRLQSDTILLVEYRRMSRDGLRARVLHAERSITLRWRIIESISPTGKRVSTSRAPDPVMTRLLAELS